MAACTLRSCVPRRRAARTSAGCSGRSAFTPASITYTRAPTARASAFTAAPPGPAGVSARKFATIAGVTSGGYALTPARATP